MIRIIFSALLLIFFILFGFNNAVIVKLNLFPFAAETEVRLYYIVFLSFLLGYIISYFIYGVKEVRLKLSLRMTKKKLVALQNRLEEQENSADDVTKHINYEK